MLTEVGQQLVHHSDDDRNRNLHLEDLLFMGAIIDSLHRYRTLPWQLALARLTTKRIAICIMRKGRRLNFETGFRFTLLFSALV
ncbi:hypothetical protein CEXT_555951 [Caerostris extrusa]|uniref:Uncharacterized protein n=1 Tax=Caerostris extrusa TaxID=172846 RepID=A0AAV4TES0_CAEEX|nr:hypothetical protein CEXT_555951 [Caerostris extrusa]